MTKILKTADPHFHGARTNRDYSGDALSSAHVMKVPGAASSTRGDGGVARLLAEARGQDELAAPRVAFGRGEARALVPTRGPVAPSDPLAMAHVSLRLVKPAPSAEEEEEEEEGGEDDDEGKDEAGDEGDKDNDDDDENEKSKNDDDDDDDDDARTARAVREAFAAMKAARPGTPARVEASARLRVAMGRG